MADTGMSNGATALESTSHIPIAQLTPLLTAPSTRSFKAIVTLTWPYSSATGSVAFLLAEPDFRLRRTRGQVRAQFSGSSAKAVAKSGIASGDEVILSLDGVEWVKDEAPFATPGRGLEFDLKFAERLSLQFRQENSQETKLIDIDHPTPEPEAPSQPRISSPEAAPSPDETAPSARSSVRASPLVNNGHEWTSPAFIKRARTSYGSLFDKEYDPFADEDGTIRGKGRKRTRLSSTWRYESRSPSPEVVQPHTMNTSPELQVQQRPVMADEACQTDGLDDGSAAEVLADFHKQALNVGRNYYATADGKTSSRAPPDVLTEVQYEYRDTQVPLVQTQLDSDRANMPDHDAQYEPLVEKISSSPQLQAVSSDALPLVPPLVDNRFGAFLEMGLMEGSADQTSKLNHHTSAPFAEPAIVAVNNVEEDLYNGSIETIHSQAQLNELNRSREASAGTNALEEASNMQSQSFSEDQYGHWQSTTAYLNHSASPPKIREQLTEEDHRDGVYVEERESGLHFQPGGFPTLEADISHLPQYPNFDDESYSQQLGVSQEHELERTAYPDLLEADGKVRGLQSSLNSRFVAMSRSGSAHSVPVDLTESSDEAMSEEEYRGQMPFEGSANEEDSGDIDVHEDFVDEGDGQLCGHTKAYRNFRDNLSEEEEEEVEEDSQDDEPVHDRHFRHVPRVEADSASQNSQDEEAPYEDGVYENFEELEEDEEDNEHYHEFPRHGFDPEQEEEFDEEEDEGSYDEDIDEDDEPPVQREPIVIDLLSSDDEDGGEPAEAKPVSESAEPRRPSEAKSPLAEHESNEADEGMEAEEGLSDDQDALLKSRTQVSTQLATDHRTDDNVDSRFTVEEDDESVDTEDDNPPDNEDYRGHEDTIEDANSNDFDPAETLTAVEQDNEMVEVDEYLEDERDDQQVEEFEPENLQEELLHDAPPLQQFNEKLDGQMPEHEYKEPGGSERIRDNDPTQSHSLLARMFNLDGANDERLPSLYPIPSKAEELTSIMAAPLSDSIPKDTAPIGALVQEQVPFQLPTPQDTQISLLKDSSQISSSPVTGHTQLLESTSDQPVVDPALEDASQSLTEHQISSTKDTVSNVEDAPTFASVISDETKKITLQQNHIEGPDTGNEEKGIIEAHHTRSRTRQQNSLEPVVDEEASSVAEAVSSTPRRSHRRGKSISSTESPQTKRLNTPSKSTSRAHQDEPISARTRSDRSSSIVLDDITSPKGQDASIELAMAALDSPTKQQPHDLRSKEPVMDMKLKLTRALRTELSEFTPLKLIRYNLTKKIDVFGVVTTVPPEPERAKTGPRHYNITLNVTDQSICPGSKEAVTEVQVFRPYKDALPIVKVGDGILLRNFQVISVKGREFALRSCEVSSWAVFKGDDEDVDVRGPPVEYGPGERKQMSMLRSWFKDLDSGAMAKINRANVDRGMAVTGQGIRKVF